MPATLTDPALASTIPQIQALMASGSITAELLATHLLARIEAHDETYRTFVELNPAALDEARAADDARKAGDGPLLGIPVTLKDNIETAGPLHTTAGAALLLENVAPEDADLVSRLRAAGAVILGKANLSEFAGVIASGPLAGGTSAVAGMGLNPHGPEFPTAGSSSGSAGGVAARMTMLSVGTETSGSLIAPAAYQGCVGMKPSQGVVSGDGVIPLMYSNDSPGPVARNVTDAALLLGAIGSDDRDFASGLDALAFSGEVAGVLVSDLAADPGNETLLDRIERTLSLAGAVIRPAVIRDDTGTMAGFAALIGAGVRFDMMPYVAGLTPSVVSLNDLVTYNAADPETRIPFGQDILITLGELSKDISAGDFAEATRNMQAAATGALVSAFDDSGASVLVSIDNTHSPFYATAGFPAVTVPLGARDTGMPAGVTLIGRIGEDAELLSRAFAFEQASRFALVADLDSSP